MHPCQGPGSASRSYELASWTPGGSFDADSKERELDDLRDKISTPDLWDDPDRARELTRRLARHEQLFGRLSAMSTGLEDAETLLDLADEESDPGAAEDASAELAELEQQLHSLEIESLLFGQYDDHDALVTVHAGLGGVDAQDWAETLLRAYLRFLEAEGFAVTLEDVSRGEEAGIKSATLSVRGDFAYGTLEGERGVHRLVRISPFDAASRRHTSFAAVDVIPEVEEAAEIEIEADDLRIDTFRAQGAGGQHVNKTDSAVRITHIPSGIVVGSQAERSQIQNRARAMAVLRAKLAEKARKEREEELDEIRGEQTEAAWGRQIRSYVLQPYQLVKDMRSALETGNVQAVLDGDLRPFVEAYLQWRRQEKEAGE